LQQWVTGSRTESVTSTATGNISALTVGTTTLASLTYNQANQLGSASGGTLSATYIYGYDGRRLTKMFPGSSPITFQYGLNGELLAENDLNGGQAADYLYLNGQPIGEIEPNAGKLYFMHTDRLGTPQRATDSSQAVVWNAYYQPFGANGTAGVSGALATQSLRLPGQYFDPETGFAHNGFRDYYGGITRYVESDPAGLQRGTNLYSYANDNPLRYLDPSGTDAEDIWGVLDTATTVYDAFNGFNGNPLTDAYDVYSNFQSFENGVNSPVFPAPTGFEGYSDATASFFEELGYLIQNYISRPLANAIFDCLYPPNPTKDYIEQRIREGRDLGRSHLDPVPLF
jgi:RHS repeat-associated protein